MFHDRDTSDLYLDHNCYEKKCEDCFQPNPQLCSKFNEWNPRKKMLILCFMLTDKCNLNCPFCWQKHGVPVYGTYTKELIDETFDYFYNNYNEYSLAIAVMGGEPTLYPDLIEEIAKKQLELYQKLSLRVYSNGFFDKERILDLCHKYENITFQISQNYPVIQYKDFAKYCEIGSIVITEQTDLEQAYNQIVKIKELGYKGTILNFDINDVKFSNPLKYKNDLMAFCERLIPLMSHDFSVNNFIDNNYYLVEKDLFVPALNLFPDGKIYLSHYKYTPAVGDLKHPLDFDKLNSVMTESPCRTCPNDDICSIHALEEFIQPDGTQRKQYSTCFRRLITVELGRKFHINRFGEDTLADREEDHFARKIRREN